MHTSEHSLSLRARTGRDQIKKQTWFFKLLFARSYPLLVTIEKQCVAMVDNDEVSRNQNKLSRSDVYFVWARRVLYSLSW